MYIYIYIYIYICMYACMYIYPWTIKAFLKERKLKKETKAKNKNKKQNLKRPPCWKSEERIKTSVLFHNPLLNTHAWLLVVPSFTLVLWCVFNFVIWRGAYIEFWFLSFAMRLKGQLFEKISCRRPFIFFLLRANYLSLPLPPLSLSLFRHINCIG